MSHEPPTPRDPRTSPEPPAARDAPTPRDPLATTTNEKTVPSRGGVALAAGVVVLLGALVVWNVVDPSLERNVRRPPSREERGAEIEQGVRRALAQAGCRDFGGRRASTESAFTLDVRVSADGRARVAAIDVERDPTSHGEVAPEALECVAHAVENIRFTQGLAVNVRMPVRM